MGAKNLGQVSGLFIGSTPPENTSLIWFDDTPSQNCHKVYDFRLRIWTNLDKNTIAALTYSELINIAKGVGLTIGQYYFIKDKANAYAIAITSTKVQYSDTSGNILIDDLGTNVQYHVTSSNLLIDGVAGVFDSVNKKLVFQFNEYTPDFTSDDYILGKVKKNNAWLLGKFKLSSFLSKVTNNSLSWNGGFFFNFSEAIKGILNKKGGVVSKDSYDTDMDELKKNLENIGKDNQTIIENCTKNINDATANTEIYKKSLPESVTAAEPVDIVKGDSLLSVLFKLQRWITKFKYATGIKISKNFSFANQKGSVNNNDTVESAIAKLQYGLDNKKLNLEEGWKPADNPNTPIEVGDGYETAISKIEADRAMKYYEKSGLVLLDDVESNGVNARFRIKNGILEIAFDNAMNMTVFYTKTIVNDVDYVLLFNFENEVLDKIMPHIFVDESLLLNRKPVIISPITTMSVVKQSDADSIWVDPKNSVTAQISLGVVKTGSDIDSTTRNRLCLVAKPISALSISEAGVVSVKEVTKTSTFQDLLVGVHTRFLIPQMTIRYQLW